MSNIILISYTPLDASGGVPRWNRDFAAEFPGTKHYSWFDFVKAYGSDAPYDEWKKAEVLNNWLKLTVKVKKDDIILVDGFWGIGLENYPNVISVAHGNWSHTTKEDVEKGIPPEFPYHHAVQVDYRKRHLARGGRIVAVSEFIAHQCKIQWDMQFPIINNAIDITEFKPSPLRINRKRPIVIHGTTTSNKGFDHIEALKKFDIDVWLLDEAATKLKLPKYSALAQADLVVHPSAHEGNSYFVLETLASGVPIVSYDVGLMYEARQMGLQNNIGHIMDRRFRSVENTVSSTNSVLNNYNLTGLMRQNARSFAEAHSLQRFWKEWRNYLTKEFPNASLPSR